MIIMFHVLMIDLLQFLPECFFTAPQSAAPVGSSAEQNIPDVFVLKKIATYFVKNHFQL